MFYVCTICMMKKGNLVKLNPELTVIVQVAVAPFVDIVELKKLVMTVCLPCTQWIKHFQEKLIPGVKNMMTLNRRFDKSSGAVWGYMSLPDVIDNNYNVFLPIANQEIVCTTDTHATDNETTLLKPTAPQNRAKPVPKRIFIKAGSIISPQSGLPNTIEDRRQFVDKKSFDDHGYSVKVPKAKPVKILARRVEMVHHIDKGRGDENNMEMPTPTIDKSTKNGMELNNTSKSTDVQRTKLKRQLYEAIQLAVKIHSQFAKSLTCDKELRSRNILSNSISEKFDISQYEPESSESALEDAPECPDSESTLSGESDYEDAENYPNIIFAKAFIGITEDASSGDQQQAHMIADPPSEWPCTREQCPLYQITEDADDSEDDEEDTPTEETSVDVDEGRRKLCKKTRLQKKNTASATLLVCAECGVSTRGYMQMAKHFATPKHIARMQWRYQCDICKRRFEFKKGIAEHIQMEHLARETLVCPMCAATFKSARALHRHAAAHIFAQTDTQDLEETQTVYARHSQNNKHTDTRRRDTQNNTTTQKRRSSQNRGTDRLSLAQDADNGDNTEYHLQEETQSLYPNHSRSHNAHTFRKDTKGTRDTQKSIPMRKNKSRARTRPFNKRKRARTNKTHARTAHNYNHEELRTQVDGYLHELPMLTNAPDNTNSAQDITYTPKPVEGYKNKHTRTNTNTRTLSRTAQNDNHKQHLDQGDDYHLHERSLHAQDSTYTQDITDNPTQGYKNKRAPANTKTDSSTAQDDPEQSLSPEDDYSQVISMLLAQENSTEAITDAPTPLHDNEINSSSTSNESHTRTAQDDPKQSLVPEDDYMGMLSVIHAEDNNRTQDITHARNKRKRARTNTITHPHTAQDYQEQSLVPDDDYLQVLSMHAQDNASAQDINHTFTLGQGYKNKRTCTNTKTDAHTAQVHMEQAVAPDDEYSQVISMLMAQENSTQDITDTPIPVHSDIHERANIRNKTHTRTAQNDNHEQLRAQKDNSHELLNHTRAKDNTTTEAFIHTPVQGNTYKRTRTNNARTYASTAQDTSHITHVQDNTRHRTYTETNNSHSNKQRNGTQNKKARGKRAKDVTYSWAQAQSHTYRQEFIHIRNGRVVKRTTRKIRTKRQKPGESDEGGAHLFQHLLV